MGYMLPDELTYLQWTHTGFIRNLQGDGGEYYRAHMPYTYMQNIERWLGEVKESQAATLTPEQHELLDALIEAARVDWERDAGIERRKAGG